MLVYISHSRRNSATASKLFDELQNRGIPAWVDIRSLEGGNEWEAEIVNAIGQATAYVFLLGPGPSDSGQNEELHRIAYRDDETESGVPLIPVTFGDVQLPGFLKTRRVMQLDAHERDLSKVADHVATVISNPSQAIDPSKVELAKKAWEESQKALSDYSKKLQAEAERSSKR